jgi:hypothetical protein
MSHSTLVTQLGLELRLPHFNGVCVPLLTSDPLHGYLHLLPSLAMEEGVSLKTGICWCHLHQISLGVSRG